MGRLYNQKFYSQRRKTLRNNLPRPEVLLWYYLRLNQQGIKFRRQFSVGRYIVDFYAPQAKLGIEVDGDSHFEDAAIFKDHKRDQNLKKTGIRILRFTNIDIRDNIQEVLEKIRGEVAVRPPLHLPLTKGEKERGSK